MFDPEDPRHQQFQSAVILRVMAAMVRKAGGELIVTPQDLVDTTFERLVLDMRGDGTARLYLRPDTQASGTKQ